MNTTQLANVIAPLPSPLLKALTSVSAGLRRRMVGVLLSVLAFSLLFHEHAAALKAWHLFQIPGTTSYFDFPTLALTLLMFTSSVQCKFADFRHLLDSPKAAVAGLVLHYVVVPAFALGCASVAVGVFDGEAARQIRLGLVFVALMPVALTASVWVRANAGNIPLLLAMVVITTGAAIVTVPLYVRLLPGMGAEHVVVPVTEMVKQLVVSITMPLLFGMFVQGRWPAFVTRWQPAFSLLGMLSLFASSGANVGAAAPMIAKHSSLLAAAAVVTLLVSGMGYALGMLLAKKLKLSREDAICLTFGSGMKNPAAAMVIGAASFPLMPLVPVPAAITSIAQHVIAAFLTRSFEEAKANEDARAVPKEARLPIGEDTHALERFVTAAFEASGRRDAELTLIVFVLDEEASASRSMLARIAASGRGNDFVCGLSHRGIGVVLSRSAPAGVNKVVDDVERIVSERTGASACRVRRWGVATTSAEETRSATQFIRAAFSDAVDSECAFIPPPMRHKEVSCTESH